MIFDTLAAAHRYTPLHPLFQTAFEWLARLDPASPPGRFTIDGGRLFANRDDAETEPREARRFESHRRYIDIQVCLEGGERIEWAPPGVLPVLQDFTPDGDIAFHAPPADVMADVRLVPGTFAIFFPGEAHRPLCALESGPGPTRKVIIKVEA